MYLSQKPQQTVGTKKETQVLYLQVLPQILSTGITTGTISTGITVESSLLEGDQGDQCLWLLWLTLAHLFTSPETYLYKHLFNIH